MNTNKEDQEMTNDYSQIINNLFNTPVLSLMLSLEQLSNYYSQLETENQSITIPHKEIVPKLNTILSLHKSNIPIIVYIFLNDFIIGTCLVYICLNYSTTGSR